MSNLTITERALKFLRERGKAEGESPVKLRLNASFNDRGGLEYELFGIADDEITEQDVKAGFDGVELFFNNIQVQFFKGLKIDFVTVEDKSAFIFNHEVSEENVH